MEKKRNILTGILSVICVVLIVAVIVLSLFLVQERKDNNEFRDKIFSSAEKESFEILTRALYPEIYFAEIKNQDSIYGFTPYLTYAKHLDDELSRLAVSGVIGWYAEDNKVPDNIFDASRNDTIWSNINSENYYFGYFALTEPKAIDEMETMSELYITTNGDKLIEWVGYKMENCHYLFGASTPVRAERNYGTDFTHPRLLMSALSQHGIIEKFVNLYYFDRGLLAINFDSMINNAYKTLGFMMYGTGRQLLEFKDNQDFYLVKSKSPFTYGWQ